ncbi:MAG: hypothetical protein AAB270_08375 [Chloroflexota bacterium]
MYATQLQSPVLQQITSPALPGAVAPAQLDITSLLGQIMPIFTMMLVFGMLMPMMKQMSGALGGGKG